MGPLQHAAQGLKTVPSDPEGVKVKRHRIAVEYSHDHALAVHSRHDRNAQVDGFAADRHLKAAVLGQAPLGDIEPGHDLDARHDGRCEALGRRVTVNQHAIDPVAHPERVFKSLDMDVGGPHLDRPVDQLVDHADHRRLAGQVLQTLDVKIQAIVARPDQFIAVALDAGLALTIEAVDGRIQDARLGDPHQRLLAGDQPDGIGSVAVQGIGHRQDDALLDLGKGQHLRLF